MLGHLMEWFYSGLGGIRQDENSIGFRHISIRPETVGNVTSAEASYISPYGIISTKWKKRHHTFELDVVIPVNTTATIYLPAEKLADITESDQAVIKKSDVKILNVKNGKAVIAVGSGQYHFEVTTKNNP